MSCQLWFELPRSTCCDVLLVLLVPRDVHALCANTKLPDSSPCVHGATHRTTNQADSLKTQSRFFNGTACKMVYLKDQYATWSGPVGPSARLVEGTHRGAGYMPLTLSPKPSNGQLPVAPTIRSEPAGHFFERSLRQPAARCQRRRGLAQQFGTHSLSLAIFPSIDTHTHTDAKRNVRTKQRANTVDEEALINNRKYETSFCKVSRNLAGNCQPQLHSVSYATACWRRNCLALAEYCGTACFCTHGCFLCGV